MKNSNFTIFGIFLTVFIFALGGIHFVDNLFWHWLSTDGCFWQDTPQGVKIISIIEGGPTKKAGIKVGDILLRIDGLAFRNGGEADRIIDSFPENSVAIYQLKRGEEALTLPVKIGKKRILPDNTYFFYWGAGIIYLVLGFLVLLKKGKERIAKLFYLASTLAGAALFISFHLGDNWWRTGLAFLTLLFGGLFPPLFLQFFLVFPQEKKVCQQYPWLYKLIYLAILPFAVLVFLKPNWIDYIVITYISFFGLISIAVLLHSLKVVQHPLKRKQLKIILAGTILGYLPFVGGFLLRFLLQRKTGIVQYTPISLVIVPISFAYTIIKHRFLDIELLFRKSLIYAIITVFIVSIYFVLVVGAGNLLVFWLGQKSPLPIISAAVLIALLFNPVRTKVQNFVDRKFFKERYDYQSSLSEFAVKLPTILDLSPLLKSISTTFAQMIRLKTVIPFIYDSAREEYFVLEPVGIADEVLKKVKLKSDKFGLVTLLKKEGKPIDLLDLENEPILTNLPLEEKVFLKKANTVLSVPMFFKNNLVGFLNLGPKLSGKMYNQEDLNFLSTIASQAALALENARLHEEELAKKEMEKELFLARQIQQKFLPPCCPIISHLEIYAVNIPSKQVSGDYYDLIQIEKNKLLVAIADVSGKGVPASLLMASIQAALRTMAEDNLSPQELVERINKLVFQNTEADKFVTFFYAILDITERTLIYVNAGHNPPFLIEENGFYHTLDKGGLLLGVFPKAAYEQGYLKLKPKDILVFYTDGVVEAMNPKEEEFGEERLKNTIVSFREKCAEEILRKVLQEVKSFTQDSPLADDLTLIVIKVK